MGKDAAKGEVRGRKRKNSRFSVASSLPVREAPLLIGKGSRNRWRSRKNEGARSLQGGGWAASRVMLTRGVFGPEYHSWSQGGLKGICLGGGYKILGKRSFRVVVQGFFWAWEDILGGEK